MFRVSHHRFAWLLAVPKGSWRVTVHEERMKIMSIGSGSIGVPPIARLRFTVDRWVGRSGCDWDLAVPSLLDRKGRDADGSSLTI
jgi:hypothetical protein